MVTIIASQTMYFPQSELNCYILIRYHKGFSYIRSYRLPKNKYSTQCVVLAKIDCGFNI